MSDFNEIVRTRSISDDDLCATCVHLEYHPGGDSVCMHPTFEPYWVKQSDENGYVVTCKEHYRMTPEDQSLLDELYNLTLLEAEEPLSTAQTERYVVIADHLKSKHINIPFGIEL